jgi:hypothetical protein
MLGFNADARVLALTHCREPIAVEVDAGECAGSRIESQFVVLYRIPAGEVTRKLMYLYFDTIEEEYVKSTRH